MSRSAAPWFLDDQPATLREQVLPGLRFEFAPDRMGSPDQRRVALPLPDRLTGDPRVAVGRPHTHGEASGCRSRSRQRHAAPVGTALLRLLHRGRRPQRPRSSSGRSLLPCDRDPGSLLLGRTSSPLTPAGQRASPSPTSPSSSKRIAECSRTVISISVPICCCKPSRPHRPATSSTWGAAMARSPSRWHSAAPMPPSGPST